MIQVESFNWKHWFSKKITIQFDSDFPKRIYFDDVHLKRILLLLKKKLSNL